MNHAPTDTDQHFAAGDALTESEISDGAFGAEPPFSIGIEEELFLVDPVSGAQVNTSGAVVERVGPVDGGVERELHACQIELISPVCDTAAQAAGTLRGLRAAVLATGAGLLGSGTHPAAPEGSAEITDKERYERIRELLGDAVVTPVGGLHVHVGMASAGEAVRAFNGLREHLPLIAALAANSPLRHGRDTGLASAREVTTRGWPRSGIPRALEDFDDFRRLARLLARAADVADYTWFWWKLRPHPRLGTVEIRALDAQTSVNDTAALAALVHCLAHVAVRSGPVADPTPPELVEEGLFRAARWGTAAFLPDRSGRLRPIGDLLAEAMQAGEAAADELGCTAELERLPALVARGGGAGRQRSIFEITGMDSLVRRLTDLTAAAD